MLQPHCKDPPFVFGLTPVYGFHGGYGEGDLVYRNLVLCNESGYPGTAKKNSF